MKRIITGAVLGLSVVALTSWAEPGPREGRGAPPEGRGPNPERIAEQMDQLGIDQDTREQLRAMHEAHRATMRSLIETQRQTMKAVRELMESGADESSVMAAVENQIAAHGEVLRTRVEHQFEVRELLGPEKTDALRAHMRDQFGPRERGDRPQRPGRADKPGRGQDRPVAE
jgi:Spy/CpxP family protein refolding chaperone